MVDQGSDTPHACLELAAPDTTTLSLMDAFAGVGTAMIQLDLNTEGNDGITRLSTLVFREQQPGSLPQRLPLPPLLTLREIAFPCGGPHGLDGWSEKRQVEFLLGRICARAAFLRARGLQSREPTSPDDFSIQADRSCRWPKGWVGSISHANEPNGGIALVKAAVVADSQATGLGIDSEAWSRFEAHSRLTSRICIEQELTLKDWDVATCDPDSNSRNAAVTACLSRSQRAAILFSAKEAIYKALAPRVGRYFGFHAVRLTEVARRSDGCLGLHFQTTEVLAPSLPQESSITGRVLVSDSRWVHTVVAIN